MKKVLLTATILLALLILIVYGSMVHIQGMTDLPGIDIKPNKTNSDFIIYEDPVIGSTNSHKNGDLLILSVKNQSNTPIHFLPGYIKIFARIDNNWINIENNIYNPEIEQILPITKDYPSGMIESTMPLIHNMSQPTIIRVFLAGQREDTRDQLGAFVDINLLP